MVSVDHRGTIENGWEKSMEVGSEQEIGCRRTVGVWLVNMRTGYVFESR